MEEFCAIGSYSVESKLSVCLKITFYVILLLCNLFCLSCELTVFTL